MRTVTIPAQTVTEAIQSVEHQIGQYVNIVIGVGSEIDGQFVFTVPQQFDSVVIQNVEEVLDPETGAVLRPAVTDYADLIAQYPNASFSTNDLWPYIDLIRSRR
jgi:hypothetical protein